jgi:hypothetical protein
MRRVATIAGVLGCFLLAVATGSRADVIAATGPIVALRTNSLNSDDYAIFHGFIVVGDSIGGYARYHWGGSYCPGKDLSEAEVSLLQRGMNNPRIWIEPRTKNGQGGNLCLVAFDLVLRSDLGVLP